MKRDLSIRDIAAKAGVSIATVSRVINNPDQVSQAMLDRVLPVIEKYDYVPNQAARNVFSKRSSAIAIFVYDMRNPFFLAIIKQLNLLALEYGFTLLICDTENDERREREYFRYCRSARVAGIVLTEGALLDSFARTLHEDPSADQQEAIKLVSIDRPVGDGIPLITSNNEQAGYEITNHLIALNHKRIAFAGYNDQLHSIDERFIGFSAALRDKGLKLPLHFLLSHNQPTKEAGARSWDSLFNGQEEVPTAVVCANDEIARGLTHRANEKGMRVPEDLSVTGFDGVDSSFSWQPITTMKQQVDRMAKKAFDYIIQDEEKRPNLELKMEFVPGNTTASL